MSALHTLANGVRVVVDPMPGLESFALCVVIRGGARWEPAERNGWSHLLEHMVFKGAGGRSAQALVEVVEAQGGWINAATGWERTSFQVRGLAGGLPLAMEVLADLLRRPVLDPEELQREKGVIGQEIAEAADTPDDRVFDLAQGCAYSGQGLGRPILGADATLAPADRPSLAAWHAGLYADPGRIVIGAAGAVDPDALLRLAEAAFGDLAPPAARLPEPEPARFTGGAHAEARKLEQAHAVWLLPGVGVRDPAWHAQRLFAEILGGGMASRLFQEAREKRGLAYAVDAYAESYEDTGMLGVYAGASAADARPLAELVAAEIRRLTDRVEPAELARAKAQSRGQMAMAREQPLHRAEQAAAQVLLFGRPLPAAETAAAVEAVDAPTLRAYGERILSAGASASAVLGPRRAGAAAAAFGHAVGASA